MTTTTRGRARWSAAARLSACIGVGCLLLSGLGGCSYLETMMQRSGSVDQRIELGWQERRSLYAREIPNYTCPAHYTLLCERGGAITYSCTCDRNSL